MIRRDKEKRDRDKGQMREKETDSENKRDIEGERARHSGFETQYLVDL